MTMTDGQSRRALRVRPETAVPPDIWKGVLSKGAFFVLEVVFLFFAQTMFTQNYERKEK